MILPAMPISDAHAAVEPTMHFVWIGNSPPNYVVRIWDIWEEELPEYFTVKRWDNAAVDAHPLLRRVVSTFKPGLSWRGTSDILRLWIVALHGGVYMDSDALPVRRLHELAPAESGWLGTVPTDSDLVLCNTFFGLPPGHPFLSHAFEEAQRQISRGVTNDHFVAGPRTFRKMYDYVAHNFPDDLPRLDPSFIMTHTKLVKDMARGRREVEVDRLRDHVAEQYKVAHP